MTVGEVLDGVDVRIVRRERLNALLLPNVPKLSKSVARTRDELIVVDRVDAEAHHVTQMIGKLVQLRPGLNVPQDAGHVTRRSEDPAVIDEPAA